MGKKKNKAFKRLTVTSISKSNWHKFDFASNVTLSCQKQTAILNTTSICSVRRLLLSRVSAIKLVARCANRHRGISVDVSSASEDRTWASQQSGHTCNSIFMWNSDDVHIQSLECVGLCEGGTCIGTYVISTGASPSLSAVQKHLFSTTVPLPHPHSFDP